MVTMELSWDHFSKLNKKQCKNALFEWYPLEDQPLWYL